MGKFEV